MNDLNPSRKLAARPRAGCFLSLFLLAGLPALVTPLRADNPPTYLFQWGSQGSGNGQFISPVGIALDSSSNVYVLDANNNCVEKFDHLGNYLTQWGSQGSGNGQFVYPGGISIDSSNNVYVSDGNNSRIEKFDHNGNYLTQWGSAGSGNGQFISPVGIAIDSSNNVYVVDANNNRVEKFTSNGNYLTQWDSAGSGIGQFGFLEGIAIDSSNHVYVTDVGNYRIEKFTGNGAYLTQWGSPGSGNGQFGNPTGIAVDSGNNVYVTDGPNNRVEKFNSNGNYLTQWGSAGSGAGQFGDPFGIAVDSTGNFIYVADNSNDRIEVFANNSHIVAPIITNQPASQAAPAGANVTFSVGVVGTAPFAYQWDSNSIAISGATNATFKLTDVSFADSASYSVLVTNSFGSQLSSNAVLTVLPVAEFVVPAYLYQIDSSAVPGGFQPNSVALDNSNNIYVSDYLNNRVLKFAANGNYLTQWGSAGSGHGQFDAPTSIAVDSGYSVYVTDANNDRVEKFDNQGNYLTQWGSSGSGNGQFSYPVGIAVDSGNDVYVVDGGNSRIEKFSGFNGAFLTKWGSAGSGNGQFDNPTFIAVDSGNNVYVADASNNRVGKFDSNGNYLTQWGGYGSGNGQFYYPFGIAVDSGNNVYVTDNGNSRVEKFNSNGNYLTQWGSPGIGNGQFSDPQGIAVDSTGNFIYVADFYNARIQIFANNPNIVPPIITNQPASQTVPAGANVTFGVGVVGTAPFAFQWDSNSIAISGATNATFTLTDVSFADSASYSVVVTNNFGGVLSGNAVLAVLPSVVTTQPASSVTTTGAVLNGSVTVGPDETVVWFEWGTDTNYGNIASITEIPGSSGTVTISNALSGLDGNLIYHYRIDATNDFGIVYGNDQQFEVGLRPAINNVFASDTTTNSATLNATVNPDGRDTSVYFIWSGHTTARVNIGSGSVPSSVQIPITGLTLGLTYNYVAWASNSAGTVSLLFNFQALPWNFTTAPLQNWQAVGSSADGSKLAAAPYGGTINTSTNSGTTWSSRFVPGASGNWIGIASSADGTKLVAAVGGFFSFQAPGPIYTSTNSGQLWTETSAPLWHWDCVASSADGNKLAAVATGGGICISADSGVTWTSNSVPAHSTNWLCVASSADGSKLVLAVNQGLIYSSTNAGSTWTTNNVPATNWQSVASSADGNKLVAAAGGYSPSVTAGNPGPIYTSTNAGATWMLQTNAPVKDWFCVASSADGNKLAAVVFGVFPGFTNSIFTSSDAGVTWTVSDAPATAWEWVASSADGSRLAAVANSSFGGTGRIYMLQTTPSPVLNLSAPENVISWIIPSLDFTLQQSPDLSNWTDVTNLPVLNLTNLENQVVLPPPDGNSFFRLMH